MKDLNTYLSEVAKKIIKPMVDGENKSDFDGVLDLTEKINTEQIHESHVLALEAWLAKFGAHIQSIVLVNCHLGEPRASVANYSAGNGEPVDDSVKIDLAAERIHFQHSPHPKKNPAVVTLAQAFSALPSLRSLNFSGNILLPSEAASFLENLRNPRLRKVTLGNKSSSQSVNNFFLNHKNLASIKLSLDAHLSEADASSIVDTIATTRTGFVVLSQLDLSYDSNHLNKLVLSLNQLIIQCPYLQKVTLNGEELDQVKKALEDNKQRVSQLCTALLTTESLIEAATGAIKDKNPEWLRLLLHVSVTPDALSHREKLLIINSGLEKITLEMRQTAINQLVDFLQQSAPDVVSLETIKARERDILIDTKNKFKEKIVNLYLQFEDDVDKISNGSDVYIATNDVDQMFEPLQEITEWTPATRKSFIDWSIRESDAIAEMIDESTLKFELLDRELKQLKIRSQQAAPTFKLLWNHGEKIPSNYLKGGDLLINYLLSAQTSWLLDEKVDEADNLVEYSVLDRLLRYAYELKSSECIKVLMDVGANPFAKAGEDQSVFMQLIGNPQESSTLERIILEPIKGPIVSSENSVAEDWISEEENTLNQIKKILDNYLVLFQAKKHSSKVQQLFTHAQPFFESRGLELQDYYQTLRQAADRSTNIESLAKLINKISIRAHQAQRGWLGKSELNDPLEKEAQAFQQHLAAHHPHRTKIKCNEAQHSRLWAEVRSVAGSIGETPALEL